MVVCLCHMYTKVPDARHDRAPSTSGDGTTTSLCWQGAELEQQPRTEQCAVVPGQSADQQSHVENLNQELNENQAYTSFINHSQDLS